MTKCNPKLTDAPVTLYFPTRAAPTTTLVLRGPDYGHTEALDKRQVIEVSAADEFITYSRGPKCWHVGMSISFLNRSQRDALEAFYDDDADGALNTFEVTIPDYSTAMPDGSLTRSTHYIGCEFENGQIEFAETNNGLFSCQLQIRASDKAFV